MLRKNKKIYKMKIINNNNNNNYKELIIKVKKKSFCNYIINYQVNMKSF